MFVEENIYPYPPRKGRSPWADAVNKPMPVVKPRPKPVGKADLEKESKRKEKDLYDRAVVEINAKLGLGERRIYVGGVSVKIITDLMIAYQAEGWTVARDTGTAGRNEYNNDLIFS